MTEMHPIARCHGGAALVDPCGLLDDVASSTRKRVWQRATAIKIVHLLPRDRCKMWNIYAKLYPRALQRLPRLRDAARVGRCAETALHTRIGDGEHKIPQVRRESFHGKRGAVEGDNAASDGGRLVHCAAGGSRPMLRFLREEDNLFRSREPLGKRERQTDA